MENVNLKPNGISDPNVEKTIKDMGDTEKQVLALEDARALLLQTKRQLEVFAADPYFQDLKKWARPSGVSDPSGNPSMVAVTAKEAVAEVDTLLARNLQELKALNSGILVK